MKDYFEAVDLMYHETTFLRSDGQKAKDTFHSTTEDAAKTAISVGATRLLIGHFSSRYLELGVYLQECKALFPDTKLALEGQVFEVPRKE